MTLYIVQMCRYADNESHSYVIGAYSSLRKALEAGLSHAIFRANKYEPTIYKTGINDTHISRTMCLTIDEAQEIYMEIAGVRYEEPVT